MRHWFAKPIYLVCLGAVLLGTAFFALGQNGRTVDELYALLVEASRTGWTAQMRRDAGELYLQLGDAHAAAAQWEAALRLTPDDEYLKRRTAELYVQYGRWSNALDAVRRLLAARPDDSWANLHYGLILAPSAPAVAAASLRRAAQAGLMPPDELIDVLEADRDSRHGLALEVGAVLADARLYAYAERAFELAAALDTARGEALASVALMRGLQGKDGQRWIDEAIATAPDSPQVYSAAGLYYRAIGQHFHSLEAFASALSLAPLEPELYAELGRSYERLGDDQSAAFWQGQAARLAPNDPRYNPPTPTPESFFITATPG